MSDGVDGRAEDGGASRTGERDGGTALKAGPADALKVFISYSRADKAIADALVGTLKGRGFDPRIDRRHLPYAEEWQKQIANLIAESDTVIWLVSPDSVKSKWCNWELGEVLRLSKRLVPVRIRAVANADLPPALGRLQLLPSEGLYDAGAHEGDLVKTLNTDFAWHKKATSLGEDARDWLANTRDGARLLRGAALSDAETWSVRTPRDAPTPASDVLELILASRRAQRSRQRATVVGSVVATVAAIALSGAAVWFGLEARDQAAEADSQRMVAEQNEQRAVEQEAEAKRQTEAAEASAGRLAVNVAKGLIDRGDVEEAALLLLDRASQFDEQTVSDEMLIALHRINESRAAKTVYDLSPGTQAFDGPDGLYFVDPTTNGILRLDGTDAPAPLFASDPTASPIRTIGFVDDNRIIIVRDDLSVQRLSPGDHAPTFVGSLAPVPVVEGREFDPQGYGGEEFRFHANGMVETSQYFTDAGGVATQFVRLFDTNSAAQLALEREGGLDYLIAPDGSEFVYAPELGGDVPYAKLTRDGRSFELTAADLAEDEFRSALFNTCLLDGFARPEDFPAATFLADAAEDTVFQGFGQRETACKQSGTSLIQTHYEYTSSGPFRHDTVIDEDGERWDLKLTLGDLAGEELSDNNTSFLTVSDDVIGGIVGANFVAASNGENLVAHVRLADASGPAHIFRPDPSGGLVAAIFEPSANQVSLYNLDYSGPREALRVERDGDLAALNAISCDSGWTIDLAVPSTGGGAVLDLISRSSTPDVSGSDQNLPFDFPREGIACIGISSDAKWAVLRPSEQGMKTSIYDLDIARASGKLAQAKVWELGDDVTSAIFMKDDILTTDASHVVKRWSRESSGDWRSQEVYRGEHPVLYAEGDSSGRRLLILEVPGQGEMISFLYSIDADERWFDLAWDRYVWTGFLADGRMAADDQSGSETYRLPNYADLVRETAKGLSERCRPSVEADYRSSPCWPAWL